MIKLEIESEQVKRLTISGRGDDIYKDLCFAVIEVLKVIKPKNRPLSRAVIEFGQMMAVLGTVGKKELDGE